jgi:anaerobic magnesium-protoporphyrin IX monomethyl ester cyclase
MSRVTLLYPSFVSENRAFPPLSLPALAAAIRQKGHDVLQIDANIEFYHWLVDPEHLDQLEAHLRSAQVTMGGSFCCLENLERHCFLTDAIQAWLPYIRRTLDAHEWNLARIDGTKCLYLLDRLEAVLALESPTGRPAVQLTSEELSAEINRNHASMLRTYVRQKLIPRILEQKPRLVGLSLMVEQQLLPALICANEIRKVAPDTHIVCGGGFISAIADKIGSRSSALFSVIDSFICFDGENAILDLLDSLEGKIPLESVTNIIWFDKAIKMVRHSRIEETGSLDLLQRPDFENLDMSLYTRSTLPYYVSKGCSYGRCAYCSDPAYSSARSRSAHRAVDEIEYLVDKYKPKTLLFVDSYINPQQMVPIAKEIIDRGIKISWVQQTRMDRFLTTEAIETFAAAGCTELWFGMETVNDRMIRLIRKGSKESIIRRILNDCCDRGIRVTLNCMIGFPTETLDEARETMSFIESLAQSYPSLTFKCNTGFVFVPRLSAFGSNPQAFGIQILNEYEWSPRLEWIPPVWRYREEFRTLDGQMFEKSYAGAAALRRKSQTSEPLKFRRDTRIALSDTCFICDENSDVIALWKLVFEAQTKVLDIQHTNKCSKETARKQIDSGISAKTTKVVRDSRRFAYVIDDGSWRRIFPLNAIYSLIVDSVERCGTIGELFDLFKSLYTDQSPIEIEHAVSYALETLALCNIVQIEGHQVKSTTTWSDRVAPRHNIGLTEDEHDDGFLTVANAPSPEHSFVQLPIFNQSTSGARRNALSIHIHRDPNT